jgi:flavin reductase (DIM6/NTAB) family NADH-FMN oxidoreductase RutF
MRNFATGVCVAATYRDGPGGRRHDAVTINSLTSVSLDPPLVSMCLRHDSRFLADLLVTRVWAMSILDAGAAGIAAALATRRETRSSAVCSLPASAGDRTGALILDAPAWLECRLRQHLGVGDHTLLIGDVLAAGSQERRPPLVYLNSRYHSMERVLPIRSGPFPGPSVEPGRRPPGQRDVVLQP